MAKIPLQDTYVDPSSGETVYGAKAVAEGRVRAVPNSERLQMLLAQSREYRRENPNADQWRVVNLACEWIDHVTTNHMYMERSTGRFFVVVGAIELLNDVMLVPEHWAP